VIGVQQKVSPTTVIVAIVVLAVVIAGIWWFTMGKKAADKGGPTIDAGAKQPTTPEEAAKAGYKQGPPGGTGGSGASPGGR
jgi:uncharacterized membrane protein YqiK